jgi:hypothetical protein
VNTTNQLSLSTHGDFPVQNGKLTFTLMATATFSGRVLPAHDGVIDRHSA